MNFLFSGYTVFNSLSIANEIHLPFPFEISSCRITDTFCFYPCETVKEILKLCTAPLLVTLYKISSFDSVYDFVQKVARVRGKYKKGGIFYVEAAARIILHDWNQGNAYI